MTRQKFTIQQLLDTSESDRAEAPATPSGIPRPALPAHVLYSPAIRPVHVLPFREDVHEDASVFEHQFPGV